jgi:hypothetical protein
MLNWALKYGQMGLSVIPLEERGKKPLLSWNEFQARIATEAEIRSWWTTWPSANIGIVTGRINGVVVVDLDGPLGIASGKALGFTSRAKVITGTGEHLYYKWTEGILNSASQLGEKVDVRGEGGYVVAPPSVHPNGRRYRFHTALKLSLLPEFPVALLAPSVSTQSVKDNIKPESWISEALEEIKNGHTHNTLVRVLGKFRAHNFSEQDAFRLLQADGMAGGMSRDDLRAKVEEIWGRYEPNEPDFKSFGVDPTREFHDRGTGNGLTIHSPTNPDSLKQFEQLRLETGENRVPGLRSGYPKLDAMLKGGLKSSRLITIAARTGVGKTNFLIGIARSLCQEGRKVLLFSTEMPYAQIWERYLASLPDREQFKRHEFFICDSFAPNLEKVEEALNDIRPDVFMFDHINHVSEEQRELGNFMQGLNYLRRHFNCAGIVTAQLNRAADWVDVKTGEKVTPRMSMIKGSGTIEQASSRVLLLSETRVTPEGTEIVGNLDKNDNGPKGLVHFMLKTAPYRMVEL